MSDSDKQAEAESHSRRGHAMARSSDITDDDFLLEVTSSSRSRSKFNSVTLLMEDFKSMQEQNVRILAELSRLLDKKSDDSSCRPKRHHSSPDSEEEENFALESGETEMPMKRSKKMNWMWMKKLIVWSTARFAKVHSTQVKIV